jgi:hypothetical protein
MLHGISTVGLGCGDPEGISGADLGFPRRLFLADGLLRGGDLRLAGGSGGGECPGLLFRAHARDVGHRSSPPFRPSCQA